MVPQCAWKTVKPLSVKWLNMENKPMKLCPKPLKIEGENNQRISKSIRSGKLMKTKTENKKNSTKRT
jgi:hypothetical protein